jgi:cytochrome c-type biogenesis protein CcmE
VKPKFLVGGAVIALALAYMIWAGLTQSAVYFVTPSELSAAPVTGKATGWAGWWSAARSPGTPPRST